MSFLSQPKPFKLKNTYIHGFLDCSGYVILNSGNLIIGNTTYPGYNANQLSLLVNGRTQMNGNVIVNGRTEMNGNVIVNGNLFVSSNNIALGLRAGNITNGIQAGLPNGLNTTAVGSFSGMNHSGINNIFIGSVAGQTSSTTYFSRTGSNNTYVGYRTSANNSAWANSTAVGTGAVITASNQIVLGTAEEIVTTGGNVRITNQTNSTNTTSGALQVSGGLGVGGAINSTSSTVIGGSASANYYGAKITTFANTNNGFGQHLLFTIKNGASEFNQASIGTIRENNAVNYSASIGFYPSVESTLTERMRITSSGYVGINTDAPAYALDVNGEVRTSGRVRMDNGLDIRAPNGGTRLRFDVENAGNCKIQAIHDAVAYRPLLINHEANVGVAIGTTTVRSAFHVSYINYSNGILVDTCQASDHEFNIIFSSLTANSVQGPSVNGTFLRFFMKDHIDEKRYIDIATNTYFTGQHMVVMDKPEIQQNLDDYVGLIISSNDTGCTSYYNGVKYTGIDAIRIDESLPNCKLSDTDNDKAVYGVITNQKNDNYFDTSGNLVYDNTDDGFERDLYDRVRVNSVGEGSIWITNINGNIDNGDYITSSIIPGYGKKQNDDILHNYTVAKSIMSCDFSLTSTRYISKTIEFNGQTYIAAFVGCTYHCG